jgi:hypothetical protein
MPAVHVDVLPWLELMLETVMPDFMSDSKPLSVRMICLLHSDNRRISLADQQAGDVIPQIHMNQSQAQMLGDHLNIDRSALEVQGVGEGFSLLSCGA